MEHLNKVEVTIHYTKGEIVLLIACIGWEHTEIIVTSLIMLCQVKVNIVLEDDCGAQREHGCKDRSYARAKHSLSVSQLSSLVADFAHVGKEKKIYILV